MVAYSFRKRFAAPILAGTKAQTIRADRKRHARPGEEIQLYTGMRTKHCKLLARVRCEAVVPVRMTFSRWGGAAAVWLEDRPMASVLLDAFARQDGFGSFLDMRLFWLCEHARDADEIDFRGVLIRWTPLAPADALDIGAAA